MFKFLIMLIVSSTNWASSLLSFLIVLLHILMTSSEIGMVMVKRVWSDERCYLE